MSLLGKEKETRRKSWQVLLFFLPKWQILVILQGFSRKISCCVRQLANFGVCPALLYLFQYTGFLNQVILYSVFLKLCREKIFRFSGSFGSVCSTSSLWTTSCNQGPWEQAPGFTYLLIFKGNNIWVVTFPHINPTSSPRERAKIEKLLIPVHYNYFWKVSTVA